MKNTKKYHSISHAKFHLSIHLILCTKYRKNILNKYGDEIKQIAVNASAGKKFNIMKMEIDQNHIHLMIDFEPSISIGYIVKVIKSQTTQKLWNEHEDELKRHYWKRRILWSGGYFACTVGDASRSTLEYYIANQG